MLATTVHKYKTTQSPDLSWKAQKSNRQTHMALILLDKIIPFHERFVYHKKRRERYIIVTNFITSCQKYRTQLLGREMLVDKGFNHVL